MTPLWVGLSWLLQSAGIAVGCEAVVPLSEDPATAAAYAKVAADAEAEGDEVTARIAWNEVLSRDPNHAQARTRREALCRAADRPQRLERALQWVDQGRCREAVEVFAALRAETHEPSLALLEGQCWYTLGDDAKARPLLQLAAEDEALASAAQLQLGLIALRSQDPVLALRELDRAGANPAFRQAAQQLARAAAQEGRLVGSVRTEVLGDSNRQFLPGDAAFPPDSADLGISAAGLLLARPWGRKGPWAEVGGGYLKQVRFARFDTGALDAAAGWYWQGETLRAGADYRFNFLSLGAAPYLLAHAVTAHVGAALGNFQTAVFYELRFEDFLAVEAQPFSGTRHQARFEAGYTFADGPTVQAGYTLVRGDTVTPSLSFLEHGPEARLWMPLFDSARLVIQAGTRFRNFDAVDPDFGVQRAEFQLDALVRGELDLSRWFTVYLSLDARRAISNAEAFTFTRVGALAGVSFTARIL